MIILNCKEKNMIFGIGIDIVEKIRIVDIIDSLQQRFLQKHFHLSERVAIEASKFTRLQLADFCAKRFAAKEACLKAAGIGIARGISLIDVEVKNNAAGKPEIILSNKLKEAIFCQDLYKDLVKNGNGEMKVHLSISDEKLYAVANVVIEII